MSKFGVNVPKGVVVSSAKEIAAVLKEDFPDDKEVHARSLSRFRALSLRSELKCSFFVCSW